MSSTDEERTEWHNLVTYERGAEVVVFDITLHNGGSSSGDAAAEKNEAGGRGHKETAPDHGDLVITDDDIGF